MSIMGATVLKVLLPGLAKALLDNLEIKNNLTNKLLEQTIDFAVDGLSEEEKHQTLVQQTSKLAKQLKSEMQPFFEQEARNLDEGGQSAIFYAVAQTLVQGGISLDGLMDISLDADRLAKHLLTSPKAIVGFSANEKSLYERTIALASHNLIETVPQLEGFQLSVTKTMLRQNEELLNFARSQKEHALQQRDQFLQCYRQVIANELDKPDKFGVPLLKNLLSRQRLCEAYVQLSITEKIEVTKEQLSLFDLVEQGDEPSSPQKTKLWETTSQNIEAALSTRRRLVIRGGAGAGKTSLMHWLAVHSARQDFEAPLQHWNSLVPFFIRLRSWVDDGFPAAQDFVQPIARNIVDEMPGGWVRQQLDSGCALVLIDGVDELPRAKRQPFFEDLQKLVTEFPNATYITTSRPAGLKDENGEEWVEWESWMQAEKFGNCIMEPMTLPVIEQFVSRWHSALPEPSQQEDKDPQSIAENLIRQLRSRAVIRKLSETPLLCTMICALNFDNEGTLPETRIQLYEDCIKMLLEERDKQRGIKTDISLSLDQKKRFLMEFAYWLMRNNYSDADVAEVDTQLQVYLENYNLPNVTGGMVRQLLLERSGLLREPLMGRIDFVHRTFQEYLAAKAILSREDLGVLLNHADEDQWRETIIVAAGEGSDKQRAKILKNLLAVGNKIKKKRYYYHLLAIACLETNVPIEPELRINIENCVKSLLPPKNDDEVDAISRAGDAIVPLLVYDSSLSANDARLCIDVLIKVGSPSAMQSLIAYAQAKFDSENEVVKTLIVPWRKKEFSGFSDIYRSLGQGYDYFEKENYIHQVLIHVQTLDLSGTQILDLSPLSSLSQLQNLNLNGTQISDLSPLSSLSQLQTLDLNGTQILDLSPLSSLSQLQNLNLNGTQILDLSPLSSLSHLRNLNLNGTQVSDLSPLSSLFQLQTLGLSGTQILDLSPLSSLSHLRNLNLNGTQVSDLSPLSSLFQLQTLGLSGTQILDLSSLSSLSQLQGLNLSGTQILDLSPLSSFTQLSWLILFDIQFLNFLPLERLAQEINLFLSISQKNIVKSFKKSKNLSIHSLPSDLQYLLNDVYF
jgi:NACHT domain/Leucine Rich repeats (2 copies)